MEPQRCPNEKKTNKKRILSVSMFDIIGQEWVFYPAEDVLSEYKLNNSLATLYMYIFFQTPRLDHGPASRQELPFFDNTVVREDISSEKKPPFLKPISSIWTCFQIVAHLKRKKPKQQQTIKQNTSTQKNLKKSKIKIKKLSACNIYLFSVNFY